MNKIEAEADAAVHGNGHHAKPAAQSPQAAPAPHHRIAERLHDGITDAAVILRELQPLVALVTTPQAARLLEALARAVHAGVPDAEVEGFIAGLHGLANKAEGQQRGSGPQPAFLPAPADGSGAM